jgi:hypothetical protein
MIRIQALELCDNFDAFNCSSVLFSGFDFCSRYDNHAQAADSAG